MNLVGLAGVAGAGKDEVARILVERHGFARVALADVMKRALATIFGLTHEQLWGSSGMRNAPDPRWTRDSHDFTHITAVTTLCRICGVPRGSKEPCQINARVLLQQLGTEYGRAMHPDVWVRYALRTAKEVLWGSPYTPQTGAASHVDATRPPPVGVVIPDVRFENEAQAIRAAGGWVMRVTRPGAGLRGAAGDHASEAGLPESRVDANVQNEGTLEDLGVAVDAVMAHAKPRSSAA